MPSTYRFGFCVALFFFIYANMATAATQRAYIGTYTSDPTQTQPRNHGEGIYLVDVNSSSGTMSNLRLVARTPSPSWIAITRDGSFLYAGNAIGNFNGSNTGSVSAFKVDRQSGELTLLNVVSSEGAGPCYVAVHPSGRYVLTANYTGGSVAVLPVKSDGALGTATDVVHPAGPINPPRAVDNPPGNFAASDHSASHPHMISFDPSGNYIFVDEAGLDKILVFKLDMSSGKLIPVSEMNTLPGSAPRHFVFDPNGELFYQLQEQDSMLTVYSFDSLAGKLKHRASVSALPNGFAGSNLASELLISESGTRLYYANRLHDTIAIFHADRKGSIKLLGEMPTGGSTPRSLAIEPNGQFIFSLNQMGDSVTVFRINSHGMLTFTGQFMAVGSPATMVFYPSH